MNDNIKLKIQQIWALLVGSASLLVGILKLIPGSNLKITLFDAAVHIITGSIFIVGAWKYVSKTNLCMGIFYILFGAIDYNLPHLIVGVVSFLLSLTMNLKEETLIGKSRWKIFSFKRR
jgi:hypothetical protein